MRTDALIVSVQPFREKDLLVRCYTEQAGLLMATARSALREGSVQGMHLDQGNIVQFDLVSAHGLPIITGATPVNAFSRTKRQLKRQAASWTLLETIGALVVGTEADDELWQEIRERFHELDQCDDADMLRVVRNGQRAMLTILGYAPRVHECGICGGEPNGHHSFSVQLGSLVCGRCAQRGWQGMALSEDDRRWLAGQQSTAPALHVTSRISTERLIEYVSGRALRSLDLLFSTFRA